MSNQKLFEQIVLFNKLAQQAQLNQQLADAAVGAIDAFLSWSFKSTFDKFVGTSSVSGQELNKDGLTKLEETLKMISSAIESKNVETIKSAVDGFKNSNYLDNTVPLNKKEEWTKVKAAVMVLSNSLV